MPTAAQCALRLTEQGANPDRIHAIQEHAKSGGDKKALLDRAKQQATAAEKRATAALHRRVKAQQQIAEAPDIVTGLQSLLVGSNRPFKGSRNSAEAAILGYKSQFLNQFRNDLGDNERLFASREVEREWVRELAELNDKTGNGNPGVTA